jgi:hypothetical protein
MTCDPSRWRLRRPASPAGRRGPRRSPRRISSRAADRRRGVQRLQERVSDPAWFADHATQALGDEFTLTDACRDLRGTGRKVKPRTGLACRNVPPRRLTRAQRGWSSASGRALHNARRPLTAGRLSNAIARRSASGSQPRQVPSRRSGVPEPLDRHDRDGRSKSPRPAWRRRRAGVTAQPVSTALVPPHEPIVATQITPVR